MLIHISACFDKHTGMGFDKSGQDGQMDLSLSHNAPLDQGRVTLIGLEYKGKKGHYGGMLTVRGLEPPYMEL